MVGLGGVGEGWCGGRRGWGPRKVVEAGGGGRAPGVGQAGGGKTGSGGGECARRAALPAARALQEDEGAKPCGLLANRERQPHGWHAESRRYDSRHRNLSAEAGARLRRVWRLLRIRRPYGEALAEPFGERAASEERVPAWPEARRGWSF
jgi:hypothetical protein